MGEGQYAGVTISQASVPGAASGDRINNEMWTSWDGRGYWIEDGIYVGHEYGTFEKSGRTTSTEPVWFYALEYNASGKHVYAERDYSSGPSVGKEWWIYHLSEGSNTWCVYFENTQAACYDPSGFETYSKSLIEGLEDYYYEKAPINNGTMIGEYQWNNGEWHTWNQAAYFASSGFCAEKPGSPYGLGSLVYSTSSCGGGADLLAGGEVQARPAAVAKVGGQLPVVIPGSAQAMPSYAPPSSAAMPTAELIAIAKRVAAEAGDASAGVAGVLRTSLGMMNASVAPYTAPTGSSPLASYDSSEVEWVELDGSFELTRAAVPNGQPQPAGTILDVGIDAHTGHVDLIETSQTPNTAEMEDLGTITK